MSGSTTPFRILLTISAVLLAVAGILGWLLPELFVDPVSESSGGLANRPPPWLPVVGIGIVLGSAFLVALSGRKVIKLATKLGAGPDGFAPGQTDGVLGSSASSGMAAGVMGESGAESSAVFLRRVRSEVSRTSRYGHDLSLLALCVDQPGGEDPTLAGLASDRVLGTIGEIVRNSTRVSDVYGHTAPNRIVVLLAETELAGAKRVAEKLRRNVEVYPFDLSSPVTVSIGVAEYRAGDDGGGIIERAESACLAASAAGGNVVETP